MAKYKVLSALSHSGTTYLAGSVADLEEGSFQPSLIGQVLELIPEPLLELIEINEEIPDRAPQAPSQAKKETKEKAPKADGEQS